jgi:hypothetical protein
MRLILTEADQRRSKRNMWNTAITICPMARPITDSIIIRFKLNRTTRTTFIVVTVRITNPMASATGRMNSLLGIINIIGITVTTHMFQEMTGPTISFKEVTLHPL